MGCIINKEKIKVLNILNHVKLFKEHSEFKNLIVKGQRLIDLSPEHFTNLINKIKRENPEQTTYLFDDKKHLFQDYSPIEIEIIQENQFNIY